MASTQQQIAQKTGLVGYPIEHSLSPVMHNAVYEHYNLPWHYALYPCDSKTKLHELIAQIQNPASGFVGINITMPYKAEVAQALKTSGGELRGAARLIKAVNCLSCKPAASATSYRAQVDFCTKPNTPANSADPANSANGEFQLLGSNVDGDGLVLDLQNRAKLDLAGAKVIIAGTGAVSSAASIALASARVASIAIVSRQSQRAWAFVAELKKQIASQYPHLSLQAFGYDEAQTLEAQMQRANLIIDATPIGMQAGDPVLLPMDFIRPEHTVLDVVYGHAETRLLQAARAARATAIDGLGMLIEQAALSFETWVGDQRLSTALDHSKTVDIMRQAALAELRRRELFLSGE